MFFLRNKYDLVSELQLRRLNFWKFLSQNLNKHGEIVNTVKFKTKEQFYAYIHRKFKYSRSQTKRLIKQFSASLDNETCIKFVKHKNSFFELHNKFLGAKWTKLLAIINIFLIIQKLKINWVKKYIFHSL